MASLLWTMLKGSVTCKQFSLPAGHSSSFSTIRSVWHLALGHSPPGVPSSLQVADRVDGAELLQEALAAGQGSSDDEVHISRWAAFMGCLTSLYAQGTACCLRLGFRIETPGRPRWAQSVNDAARCCYALLHNLRFSKACSCPDACCPAPTLMLVLLSLHLHSGSEDGEGCAEEGWQTVGSDELGSEDLTGMSESGEGTETPFVRHACPTDLAWVRHSTNSC